MKTVKVRLASKEQCFPDQNPFTVKAFDSLTVDVGTITLIKTGIYLVLPEDTSIRVNKQIREDIYIHGCSLSLDGEMIIEASSTKTEPMNYVGHEKNNPITVYLAKGEDIAEICILSSPVEFVRYSNITDGGIVVFQTELEKPPI